MDDLTVEEFEEMKTSEAPAVLKIYADWCGPCRSMAPVFESVAEQYDLSVAAVDVEQTPEIASEFDVKTIPTFVAFEGEAVEIRVGSQTEEELHELFECITG